MALKCGHILSRNAAIRIAKMPTRARAQVQNSTSPFVQNSAHDIPINILIPIHSIIDLESKSLDFFVIVLTN